MNELQSKLLDILKWFHSFCEENGLKYYVAYGTLLGAVRHNGFIPWDDDIDVHMPRNDYERFIALTFEKKQEKFLVESYRNGKKDFCYAFSKIYDTNTSLIEKKYKSIIRGVYIDVFPLDGLPADEKKSNKFLKRLCLKKNILYTRTVALRKDRELKKNIAIILSRLIPSFILNNQKLIREIDNFSRSYSYEQSVYVGSLLSGEGMKERLDKSIFGNPVKYKFESLYVYGPEKSDEYLTHFYGDYMLLPPVNERKSNHRNEMIDLEKAFL